MIPEQQANAKSEIITEYTLLSLTRGYVRQQLDNEPLLKRTIMERMQKVQSLVEEAERAKKQYRFSLANLDASSDEEKVAAMLAQAAFQKYQGGRYADAVEDYKRAQQIAPRFPSLYRNWAVMESQERHFIEAEELMRKAADLAPKDPQIWLVWGHIKRKEDKVKEALQKYEAAYRLSPNDGVVLNSMGQAKSRLGDFDDAEKLFKLASENESPGDSYKNKIINLSSLADNLLRWADSLEKSGNYDLAKTKLIDALSLCIDALSLDPNDIKSQDLQRRTFITLGFLHLNRLRDRTNALSYFQKAIVHKPVRDMNYREGRDTVIATIQAAQLLLSLNRVADAKTLLSPELRRIRVPFLRDPDLQKRFENLLSEVAREEQVVIGEIIRVNTGRGFAIIETKPGETYLGHVYEFTPRIETLVATMVGSKVSFIPLMKNFGSGDSRKTAQNIRFVD